MNDSTRNKPLAYQHKIKNYERYRHKKKALFIRWLMIGLFPVAIFTSPTEISTSSIVFFITAYFLYNVVISLYLMQRNKKGKKVSCLYVYLDIVFLSIFNYLLGGYNPEVLVLFIFTLGYYGISSPFTNLIKLTAFSVVLFTISFLFSTSFSFSNFNTILVIRVLVKDSLLVFASIGIDFIRSEVKKYNEMHRREFKLARTDKLTGLANRHYFEQKLGEEAMCADISGSSINVLIFDLDDFKKFNDTYGHIMGDKLLVLFSDIIRHNIRKNDIPVRYGGEEFLVLIQEKDIELAKSIGERIRKQLESQRIYIGSDSSRNRITVSCGIAQYPRHSGNIRKIIEYADKALYLAKERGKNTVVCYDEAN